MFQCIFSVIMFFSHGIQFLRKSRYGTQFLRYVKYQSIFCFTSQICIQFFLLSFIDYAYVYRVTKNKKLCFLFHHVRLTSQFGPCNNHGPDRFARITPIDNHNRGSNFYIYIFDHLNVFFTSCSLQMIYQNPIYDAIMARFSFREPSMYILVMSTIFMLKLF